MSIEFEKAVLTKLDRIESKLAVHKQLLNEHTQLFNKVFDKLSEHEQILNEHSQSFNKVYEELADMREIIISNHNTLVLSEHEFYEKFGVLFDSFSVNEDAHQVFLKTISTLNTKIFNHDMRISHLEDLNKKDFAKALLLDFPELEKLNNPLIKYLNTSTNTSAKK